MESAARAPARTPARQPILTVAHPAQQYRDPCANGRETLIERIAHMTHADSPADRRPPTEEDGFVKWLQLGLLLVIAAALLWGAESVRSFPARVFSGPRPPQLDEGRRAFASHNYTLAATLFAEVIERSSGTHARGAALLLPDARLPTERRGRGL